MAVVAAPQNALNVSLNGSLTCLGWLQTLGCRSGLQQPLSSPSAPAFSTVRVKQSQPSKKKSKSSKKSPAPSYQTTSITGSASDLDPLISCWNSASADKPPHCYATLIYMAMRGKSKVTLGEIYSFVKSNFKYYKANDNGWKNSIRHNLTQHNCFVKVQRTDEHPGKGGFWTLSADHASMFQNGIFKRKRRKIPQSNSIRAKSAGKSSSSFKSKRKLKNCVMQSIKEENYTQKRPVFFCSKPPAKPPTTMTGLLGIADVMPADDSEVLDGIDWDALVPDLPTTAGMIDDVVKSEPGHIDHRSMLGALSLMETSTTPSLMETSAGSPISILPDVSLSDGSATPPHEEFTLNELHAELDGGPKLSVAQQLNAVERKLDLEASLSKMSESEGCSWAGEELAVVGTGMTLSEGIVPTIGDARYNHVLLTDLDDLDQPIPADWIV
jgi:hypothetical protein